MELALGLVSSFLSGPEPLPLFLEFELVLEPVLEQLGPASRLGPAIVFELELEFESTWVQAKLLE